MFEKQYFEDMAKEAGFAAYVFHHLSKAQSSNTYQAVLIDDDNAIYLLGGTRKEEREFLLYLCNAEDLLQGGIDWNYIVFTRIEPNAYIEDSIDEIETCTQLNNFLPFEYDERYYNLFCGIRDLYTEFMDEFELW